MTIRTIPRDAGDTSKGFTLQKLRATSLMLTHYDSDNPVDFLAAVEYGGDIYLDTQRITYIEESKAYSSKDFSFASHEVKNTIVYFIDHWLKNSQSDRIQFAFYSTNGISKEIVAGAVKDKGVELPEKPILELLIAKDYDIENLLSAVKQIILNEYHSQYSNNKTYKLEESYYDTLIKFEDKDWISFLSKIQWNFNQDDIDELESKVLNQILAIKIPGLNIEGKEHFICAKLFYDLEIRQNKTKIEERFIDKNYVELTFRRVHTSGIDDDSYKFLFLDYNELRQNTKRHLELFIADKYYAITGNKRNPALLNRKVALFDPSLKIKSKSTEIPGASKDYTVEGLFSSFVNTDKPAFLFGELGGGKSTIVASYMISLIESSPEIVPLFIPSSYLQDKECKDLESFSSLITRYVNNELPLKDKFFDFDTLYKTGKETVLIIDGIDELPLSRAQTLITLLKRLKDSTSHLRVIATGRPIELEGIVPSGWHTLITIALTEDEILSIFLNEAIANGIGEPDAKRDAENRLTILKSRNELHAIATTPIVACSIWPDLNDSLEGKSLGDLLYNVILRRLTWHESDQKDLELNNFLENYPNVSQREILLVSLAKQIFNSPSKSIPETSIINTLSASIPESENKNRIAHEASIFFKTVFLQKTTDDKYGFISSPLLECATAIGILQEVKSTELSYEFHTIWRILSFAMAIARRKEETDSIRPNVSLLLHKELKWPNHNVAPVAIILAELRDKKLSEEFIKILTTLEYRPLRTLEQKDHLTYYSIAFCLMLSEDKGFEWFFSEYLDCKIPLIHYEAKLVADILAYYFLICDLNLSHDKKEKLNSLIQPNINCATSLCFELLPCLSLIASADLPIRQRSLLLADLLKDDTLLFRAEILLKTTADTNPDAVLNALETVCSKTEFTENATAAFLWLQINKTRPLSIAVLNNILTAATRKNVDEIFVTLDPYIKEKDLTAYLRYCIIIGNKLAGHASLILFWKGERDFNLLSHGLITSIDWLSQQYTEVNEIAPFIATGKDEAITILIQNMPLSNHLGIPPSYWRMFLDALNKSDQFYEQAFANAVSNLRHFVLTRYPDIRISLTTLLENKPAYKDFLKKVSTRLNRALRNGANSILVTCFPDQEFESLHRTISGFYESSSNTQEWQSFCLGLNYSEKTLQQIHDRLGEYVEGAKTYALILLYYHKYSLTDAEINDLVNGLLGPGYFFDRTTVRFSDSQSGILSHPSFSDKLISYLSDADVKKAERAGNLLLDFHNKTLTTEQRASAWSLRIEDYEQYFFDFSLEQESLLADPAFSKAVASYSETQKKETILNLFLSTQTKPDAWKEFLLRFITKSESFDHGILYRVLHWLISYTRKFPDKAPDVSNALSTLLLIPAYKESARDSNVYLYLLLLADHFGADNKAEIQNKIQDSHYFVNEELILALALRSVFPIPVNFIPSRTQNHITLFATYDASFITEVPKEELELYLIDTENISDQLLSKIEQILLFGQLDEAQLQTISVKSSLGAYLSILLSYCRHLKVDIDKLFETRDIGGVKTYQFPTTQKHRKIIIKLYRFLLRSEENLQIYFASLRKQLDDPNNKNFHEHLLELIARDEPISFNHFERLLSDLLDRPYLIKEDMSEYLSHFLANHVTAGEKENYCRAIENFLSAIVNRFDKEGQDGQYNLILWLFSIALIHLSQRTSDIAKESFLLGLRYVFLEKNNMARALIHPPEIFFRAGDLLHYTNVLFSKIKQETIRELIETGVESNIPEISACCRVLYAISGNPVS